MPQRQASAPHVMSAWLSPQSLAALAVTLIFLAVALQRPSRAVLAYAVLGAAPPILQLGAFSGRTISQGLLLAEALATVLFGAWLSRHHARRGPGPASTKPLFVFVAVVPGVDGRRSWCCPTTASRTAPRRRSRSARSCWCCGRWASTWRPAEFITDTTQLRWLQRAMVTLAIAAAGGALRAAARGGRTSAGCATFGTFASPFALAAMFSTTSVPARASLRADRAAALRARRRRRQGVPLRLRGRRRC